MEYRALCEEYVFLMRRFREYSLLPEVLECASKALQISKGKFEDIRVLLGQVAMDFDGRQPENSWELQRLRNYKRKLDNALAAELSVSRESLDTLARGLTACDQNTSEQVSAPEDLTRRFGRILTRLQKDSGDDTQDLSGRLNAVAHRLNIDLDGAESSLEDNEESNDWLSESNLAHEIHDLANRCYKSGSLEEAAELYDLVLEIAPDTLESFFNRGLARCRLRSYELAAQDLRHVIQMNPDLAEAYYTLGLIEQYRGDLDAAIAQYEKAFEVDPKYEKARQELLEAKTKKQEGASPSSASSTSTTDDAGLIRDFSVYARKPDCNFAMVGGCWAAKRQLRLITEYLRGSQLFQKWGIRPPRGVLLYGPSGTGKTLLAEALAGEVDCPCYMPPVGIFQSVWAGYTEANFRRLWEEASSHRAAIIFLDEFDSLASCRSDSRAATGEHWYNRIVGAILGLMSSSPERLVVIAATNCLHNIDPAFLRPGRFEYLIPVDMPTAEELAEIWLIHLQRVEEKAGRIPVLDRPLHEVVFAERQQWLRGAFCDLDMSGIVGLARLSREQGLTGADVAEVVRRVAASRLEVEFELNVDFGPLSLSDFRQELKGYQVSVHRRLAWAEEET